MNYKSKISLLLLFVIVAIACRKDWQKSPEEETSAFLTEAKSYYYEQQRASPPPPTKTLNAQSVASVTGLGKLSPLWHRNYASSTKALQFVEVPLVNSQKRVTLYNFNAKPTSAQINIARVKASFQRVLIYKTKRNRFHQLLLTYVPDYDYLQQKNFNASNNQIDKIAANFSGYILYSSLKTGRNIQLLQFDDGKMVKKRYLSGAAKGYVKGNQQQNQKGGTQTMGWEYQCVDIYETPCITAGDPGVEVCQDPIKVGEECGDVWVDDPEEPEPPGEGDPCDDPANFWMCNPDDPEPCTDCEEPDPDDAEEALDTDCESFSFVKTSGANWQEAGLNKISLRMVWAGGNGIIVRNMEVNHLVFGLPTFYTNSATGAVTTVSTGQAANIAAQATEYARNMTYTNFRNSPTYPQDAVIISYFKSKVNEYMVGHMGTVGANGSGSPLIQFRNEQRSHYSNPNDC